MRVPPSPDPKRFDSDREALPFPMGGVFAGQRAPDLRADDVTAHTEIVAELDRHLDAMQEHLDTLAEEFDAPIPFSAFMDDDEDGTDDHWPAA